MSAEGKSRALADLDAAHSEFQQAVGGIPEAKLTVPMHGEWTAKDLIAHVSSWEEMGALDLQRVTRGHVPLLASFREADVDQWNAFLMRGRRIFPPAQVLGELNSSHEMLLAAMSSVPEAMFQPGQMVANFLAIATHHYRDHAGHIHEWRGREGV